MDIMLVLVLTSTAVCLFIFFLAVSHLSTQL